MVSPLLQRGSAVRRRLLTCTVVKRTICRFCGSRRVTPFLVLPDMPLTDQLLREEELGAEFLGPIEVFVCSQCGLTQTMQDLEALGYYQDYQYAASCSPFAQQFMLQLALQTWETYRLQAGDTVIDIGCSDGALLSQFKSLGARVFGFEPSEVLANATRAKGIPVSPRLFDQSAVHDVPEELLPARVVVSTYTFDHLPDPLAFLQSVKGILDQERGVLIMEVHDLEKILKRREYCLFAHEHTAYYTMATIEMLLRKAGLSLIQGNLVPEAERRGNSLLVVSTPAGSVFARPSSHLTCSWDSQHFARYLRFARAVDDSIQRMRQWLLNERRRGLRIAGYGAGGRGVMTLAAISQPGSFSYVCDKNPVLHGLYTPGAHVLVDSPERLLTDPVDALVVFSFGYFQEIWDDLADFRARGGQLISLLDLL